jgi:hypothetical protein
LAPGGEGQVARHDTAAAAQGGAIFHYPVDRTEDRAAVGEGLGSRPGKIDRRASGTGAVTERTAYHGDVVGHIQHGFTQCPRKVRAPP